MTTQTLQIKVMLQIQKTAEEVFNAIIDPAKMTNYFIETSSGAMEANTQLTWKFPEFAMPVPVSVSNVDANRYISFYWDGYAGKKTLVEITVTPAADEATKITVTEKGAENNEAGIKWLSGNTEGWANFLACMKAWLEYGVHLRKGAFDFLKENNSDKDFAGVQN